MYKDVLRSIDGIAIFPVISLIIFVIFFAVLIIYVLKVDKKFIKKMKDMPLSDKETTKKKNSKSHE